MAVPRAEDPSLRLDGLAFLGELALDAFVGAVTGVLPMARCLAAAGVRRLIVPVENARESALADGIEALGASSLQACAEYLRGEGRLVAGVRDASPPAPTREPDLAAVRGQGQAKRSLEIAAAGGHNLLMTGPPGTGHRSLRCIVFERSGCGQGIDGQHIIHWPDGGPTELDNLVLL